MPQNRKNNSHLYLTFVIYSLAATFYCYEYYLRVAPSIMCEELKHAYNLTNAGVGALSAYYYYAYMPLQIPVGLLIDKFGARRILTFACLLCVIGSFSFTHAEHLLTAQMGRFLIGFGSAFVFVGVLKLSNSWLPAKFYAMMVGLCMLLGMFGAMAGEIIMAKLVQQIGWQKTLDSATLFGIILLILLGLIIRDYPKNTHPHYQPRTKQFKLYPTLVKIMYNKQLWYAGIIGCFTFLPLSNFAEMWAVPYLETAGYSKSQAAFGSSMVFLGFGLGSPIWGIISDAIQSRKLPLIFGALFAGLCALLVILSPTLPKFLIYSCLFGCGLFTSAEILVFAIGNDHAHNSISGTTVSFVNMIVMLGGIIFQPITGKLVDLFNQYNLFGPQVIYNYQLALITLPIGLFFASLLSTRCKESYQNTYTVKDPEFCDKALKSSPAFEF